MSAADPNFPERPEFAWLRFCAGIAFEPPFGIRSGGAWKTGLGDELLRGRFCGGRAGGMARGIGAWRIGGDMRGIDMGGMRIGGPPDWLPRWAQAGAASKAATERIKLASAPF